MAHFRKSAPHRAKRRQEMTVDARKRQPAPSGDSARRKAPRSVTRQVVHPCRGFAVAQLAEMERHGLAQLFGGQNR
jgi:hypothetical protein